MSTLTTIQTELKAPKSKYNSFGKYNYRSCEDILEAVKPLLSKYEASLTIRDEMIAVGERIYVKAIATFRSKDGDAEATAFAREPESKKGMDESQITGTASSYARKYALNGLFLIDDTKDADTDEYTAQTQDISGKIISQQKANALQILLMEKNVNAEKLLEQYGVKSVKDLNEKQHADIIRRLNK